ncbi:MAG TPA: hypothetical protein DCX54_05315 [Flavobacteriales bacterium]|nr:hypothetical protein [Flavobacteriales bacterium]
MAIHFRTELKRGKSIYPDFSYNKPLSLIGSCFSTNIAEKLKEYRFAHVSNPFGVTYDPISIANQLDRLIKKDLFEKKDLFQRNGRWNSFELHGSYLSQNADDLIHRVNLDITNCSEILKESSHLFVTLGTAWIYELKETGNVVNNCHKIPSDSFRKRLLTVDEIVPVFRDILDRLMKWNPGLIPVFTISPVRHLKDGFEENSLSKSILRIAINELKENSSIIYFPSYEIVMDDLRDYRFYKDDLLHPNDLAINYIWEKLCDAFLSAETKSQLSEIEAVNKALNHRAFDPMSPEHRDFILKTTDTMRRLEKNIPTISFEKELKQLLDRIAR